MFLRMIGQENRALQLLVSVSTTSSIILAEISRLLVEPLYQNFPTAEYAYPTVKRRVNDTSIRTRSHLTRLD